MQTQFLAKDGEVFQVRSLQQGDDQVLKQFAENLSSTSQELFCPYPWNNPTELSPALAKAVEDSLAQIDAAFVMLNSQAQPVGHFFLWKIGGNSLSQKFQIEVPELGIAIADVYQGKGLGTQAVQFLQNLARGLNKDAIELTTAMGNEGGFNTYQKAGFEYVGNILNPLEVNVTDQVEGKIAASKFRQERQMVYIINEAKRQEILNYLKYKRELKKQP